MSNWISVNDRLPESHVQVLAVKRLKSGREEITLAYCIPDWEITDPVTGRKKYGPYWVCGGNNNILWWMPLPEMPS